MNADLVLKKHLALSTMLEMLCSIIIIWKTVTYMPPTQFCF